MKPKHQRLVFIGVSVVFLCLAALMTLRAFRDNLIFFYTPSELASHAVSSEQRIRVGGLVEKGSITRGVNNALHFKITDGTASLSVDYQGLPPTLFREGQGAIAEGHLENGRLNAARILAKHDEYYMPKEVVDALKKSGRWRGKEGIGD